MAGTGKRRDSAIGSWRVHAKPPESAMRLQNASSRRDHFAFDITRHEMLPLAERVWRLRHQFTSYDACYLALAEALEVPLLTCDSKLDTTGHRAHIDVVARTH